MSKATSYPIVTGVSSVPAKSNSYVVPPPAVSTAVIPSPAVSTAVVPPPAASTGKVTVTPPASTVVVPPPVAANSTAKAPGTGVSYTSPASPSISAFKGAGSRVAASGASLAAVLGFAAYLL